MKTQTTTWRPLTCGCVLHFQWLDNGSDGEKTHIPVETNGLGEPTVRCEIHAHIQDLVELHAAVIDHNRSFNDGD